MPCYEPPNPRYEPSNLVTVEEAGLCAIMHWLVENKLVDKAMSEIDWAAAGISVETFSRWWQTHKLQDAQWARQR